MSVILVHVYDVLIHSTSLHTVPSRPDPYGYRGTRVMVVRPICPRVADHRSLWVMRQCLVHIIMMLD